MKVNALNCQEISVIYDKNVEPYTYATEELIKYLQKVCNFTFKENEKAKHYVVIGMHALSEKIIARYNVATFTADEFRIVEENANWYLFGGSPRACIYAVYEWIERVLGVRWLNQDGIVIPQKTEIELPSCEIKAKPYFEQRHYLMWQTMRDSETYMHHRFMSSDGGGEVKHGFRKLWSDRISSSHSSLEFCSAEKYVDEHPEFFSKKERDSETGLMVTDYELCYSNGILDSGKIDERMSISTAKVVAESLYTFIKEDREAKYFMFGRQDNRLAICRCERCQRRRVEYGNEAGVMIVFLNAVIKRVENRLIKEGIESDFGVVTFAYHSTVNPPVVNGTQPVSPLVVPCERLSIRYAPIDADYTYSMLDERQKPEIRSQLTGWTALTRNIMIWDYCCFFPEYAWYFPNLWYFKENIRLYADTGMTYVFNQGSYSIEREWQGEMKSYIASKLYWNLDLDVETLREEYIRGYYGICADKILAYVDMMDEFFAEKVKGGLHIPILGLHHKYLAPETYPIEILLKGYELVSSALSDLDKAQMDAKEKEEMRIRLYRVLLTPLRMISYNEDAYFPSGDGKFMRMFLETAKATGLKNLGECRPIFALFAEEGKTDYRIALGQEPTETAKEVAKYLQNRLKEKWGLELPIIDDSTLYPSSNERVICVGEGMMFREFFKGSVPIEEYEYFVELREWVAFVHGTGNMKKAADIFLESLTVTVQDGVQRIQIPTQKHFKRL